MKKITLTRGLFAMVDDEDYGYINQWKWNAKLTGKNWYATRGVWINQKRVTVFMHRVIMKTPEGLYTDHIDHNGLNNQKSNLRFCTNSQNQSNSIIIKSGSSKYRGVNFKMTKTKIKGKTYSYPFWRASIRIIEDGKRKRKDLGLFKKEIDAAKAYNEAAIKHHGDFATLNKFEEDLIGAEQK